jgi:hypothetical protein
MGPDGYPMELHHRDRTPDGGLIPMTRTDHRLGETTKRTIEVRMSTDIFESCTRAAGDVAGVFEYSDDVGHFYLYALNRRPDEKILDSIFVASGQIDFGAHDVSVRWNSNEESVGLFIRGILWAVFDFSEHRKYGGNYISGLKPALPITAALGF